MDEFDDPVLRDALRNTAGDPGDERAAFQRVPRGGRPGATAPPCGDGRRVGGGGDPGRHRCRCRVPGRRGTPDAGDDTDNARAADDRADDVHRPGDHGPSDHDDGAGDHPRPRRTTTSRPAAAPTTVPSPVTNPPPTNPPVTQPPATQPPATQPPPPPETDAPPPAPETQTFSSGGGSIRVRLADGALSLASTPSPAAGYLYRVEDEGPERVRVRFCGPEDSYRITVTAPNGSMDGDVEPGSATGACG